MEKDILKLLSEITIEQFIEYLDMDIINKEYNGLSLEMTIEEYIKKYI